jgi:hypothetical protein
MVDRTRVDMGHFLLGDTALSLAAARKRPNDVRGCRNGVLSALLDGRQNFARLHVRCTRPGTIHLWALDLLAFIGRDLRPQPLEFRVRTSFVVQRHPLQRSLR